MPTWTNHPGEHETFEPGSGRLAPRAANARSDARSYSLNGTWRFRLSSTALVAEDFARVDSVDSLTSANKRDASWRPGGTLPPREELLQPEAQDEDGWSDIVVPSHWVLEGHGLPAYQNINFPFPCDPPFVPTENPTGDYVRAFDIPEEFVKGNGSVRLRFDGVESWFKVWLNGHLLGWSTGSRLPTEFDVTSHLRSTNIIAVRVHQWSTATYLEDQDQWWLPGIFRDVTLCHRPEGCVEDYFVKADYDHETKMGKLVVECQPGGRVIIPEFDIDVATGTPITIAVQPWSAESPKLYTGTLQTAGERIPLSIGFRTVEIRDGVIKINGRRIHFKGVNRHEFHPQTGRTLDVATMIEDIKLMKQYSFNAVRTSHYPPDHRFLELCDEYGLWVIDEVDLETHGFCREPTSQPGWKNNATDDARFEQAIVDRAERTITRDKNRCSIVIWSMGNEAGYGRNIAPMVQRVRQLDSSRPVHYEGDRDCYNVDMYSLMYKSHADMELLGKHEEPPVEGDPQQDAKRRQMPFILQEYAHAMGNGPGGFIEYRDLFERYPRLQGGFVWEWIDHGFPAKDASGRPFWAYGGDFGEEAHDGNFICDGMVFPDRTPSPSMVEYKKVFQPVRFGLVKDHIELHNVQDFATSGGLSIDWIFEVDGDQVAQGKLDFGPVPAGEKGRAEMPSLPDVPPAQEGWMKITARLDNDAIWADRGHVVAWDQFQTKSPHRQAPTYLPTSTHMQDRLVSFGPAVFDRHNGALVKLGDMPIQNYHLDLWRALIDNDHKGLSLVNKISAPDRPVPGFDRMKTRLDEISWDQDSLRIVTRVAPMVRQIGLKVTYTYRVTSSSALDVTVHVKPEGDWGDLFLPRLGIRFGVDQRYGSVEWYGLGPGESYSDSHAGSPVGRWSRTVDEMQTPCVFPQENGSRMGVRWAELRDGSRGIRIDGSPQFCLTARRWTTEHLHAAKHSSDLVPSPDTIWINVDHALHGLGSAACGPPTLPEYELRPVETTFGFVLRPLDE